MNYASIASEVNNLNSSYTSYVSSNFKTDTFSSIWSGPAATTLLEDLKIVIDKVKQNDGHISSFVSALNNLETYKSKKELFERKDNELSSKKNQLANTIDDEDHARTISTLRSQINSLQTEVNSLDSEIKTLRSKIVSELGSISSISTSIVAKSSVDVSGDLDGYVVNLTELLSVYKSGSLKNVNGSLYNYYSKEEVQQTLDNIQSQYTGRAAAVNSALSILDLASDKGVKLNYVWGGGHTSVTSLDAIASGVDCSAFVSWAINQGTPQTFNTETTKGLIHEGRQVSYDQAKSGDILVSGSHAILIVDNDANAKTFLVAEAASDVAGVVLRTRSYSSILDQYQARDLSSLYGE